MKWNVAERRMLHLLETLARIDKQTFWTLAHDMPDNKIIEKVRFFLKNAIYPKEIIEILDIIFRSYSICQENRNRLIHHTASICRAGLKFEKITKYYDQTDSMKSSLGHMRRCADDINNLIGTMADCDVIIALFQKNGHLLGLGGTELKLPPLLPEPQRLWSPPPRRLAKSARRPKPDLRG